MSTKSNEHSLIPVGFRSPDMPVPITACLLLGVGFVALFACYWIFSANPGLDLEVTNGFFNKALQRFDWHFDPDVHFVRKMILTSIAAFYFAAAFFGLRAFRTQDASMFLTWPQWLYVASAGMIGSVQLVNVLLKGNWGRARPKDVMEFGGEYQFTPFWQWADQCRDNCSFVSGEVSSVVMIFMSLALVSTLKWRVIWLLLAIPLYLLTVWLRVATGFHFLSDTLVSVPLMLIVASATYLWFCRPTNYLIGRIERIAVSRLGQ